MKASALFPFFIFYFLLSVQAQKTTSWPDSTVVHKDTTAIDKTTIVRDGSSYEKAIVIREKKEEEGGKAEYSWIKKKYPGSRPHKQSLNFKDKKSYDIIYITTADGNEVAVYFDISNFFGKF
jgi:hypothetical protein